MPIKDWNDALKPREKLVNCGIEQLSDGELLAILLKSGNNEYNAVELANYLLHSCGGLANLMSCSVDELMQFKGIGLAKACELVSCQELVRRINYQKLLNQDSLNQPDKVVAWLQSQIGLNQQECFVVIFLDGKRRVKGYQMMFKGENNTVSIDPKVVFQEALKNKASAVILAHNHPSQVVRPSLADDTTTKDLVEAGKLLEIPVLDHLIISYEDYYSYRQHGIL